MTREEKDETYDFLETDIYKPDKPSLGDFMDMLNNEICLKAGYQFVDDDGNVIDTKRIVMKRIVNHLKLNGTKTVREYKSEFARIYLEIYEDKPKECILTHLFVKEEHRRKGYGQQALTQAEEFAKELGCVETYLKVEKNSWMHEWYKRNGYSFYCPEDDDEDVWLFKVL